MNFLFNPAFLLLTSLLREVCVLPFRKTLHHFRGQDLRHHCQRLAEQVSVLPALKSIICSFYSQKFLSDGPGLAASELCTGLDCNKTQFLAPQRQRAKFYDDGFLMAKQTEGW